MNFRFVPCVPLALAAVVASSGADAQVLRVRNNHDLPYRGAIRIAVAVPDGSYGSGGVTADVRDGVARIVGPLAAKGSVLLARRGDAVARPFTSGPLAVVPRAGALGLSWNGRTFGTLDIALAVIPGTTGQPEQAVDAFQSLPLAWTLGDDGTLGATLDREGYALRLVASPYGGGWLDLSATLSRSPGAADTSKSYLALVRRVATPSVRSPRLRFNGRVFQTAVSPDTWDRDFWYTRGVDWTSWKSGALSIAAVSSFTPAPTIQRPNGHWVEGSHFHVWERTRRTDGAMWLISEIAGPNENQAKSRYMPVTPYAPLLAGDTVRLSWRLAVAAAPAAGWEESQLRGFAGHRATHASGDTVTVDVGVPHVTFATAYFPFSTLNENFDYYRTAGLDRETFWSFSPTLWAKWRQLAPRMRGDLHIAKAMGFERVRLHHLELLQQMDRTEALAFLDFYMDEARALGMKVLVDSEGPNEWLALLARRYATDLAGVELENEILILGVKKGDPERWTSQYRTIRQNAPNVEVFLTAAGNNGMFERLRTLGVPFDRVGLHAYKHGPQWKEAYNSHAMGTAGYAASIGKTVVLGEFNWKELTLMSPTERRPHYRDVFETVLSARAIPDFYEFQFQESMSFNPAVAGTYTRHYEPLTLDRRPKPEAVELLKVIRKYGPHDAPVSTLPVTIPEAVAKDGRATVPFTVVNRTGRPQTIAVTALAFDGISSALLTPATVSLAPGATHRGRLELTLPDSAAPGVYHHFVRLELGGRPHVGWGILSKRGAPIFDAVSPLADRVRYREGADVVQRVNWDRPLAITFGETASVLEVETAYQLLNTLQSATGRYIWLSSIAALPDSLKRNSTVLMIGTPTTHSAVAAAGVVDSGLAAKQGIVALADVSGNSQRLYLAGNDRQGAQAGAADVLLRYWKNAKDATTRLSGLERGAALGNKAGVGEVDLP